MGYGITNQSQLIDLNAIRQGVANFKNALLDLDRSGATVIGAGSTCTSRALSLDGSSLEFSITDLGTEMKETKKMMCNYADEIYYAAQVVYNQQVRELNEYLTMVAQQQSQSNN